MENVIIAPNAVGDEYLTDVLSSSLSRRKLGLDAEGSWIGTVSSLVDYEDIGRLFSTTARRIPSYLELLTFRKCSEALKIPMGHESERRAYQDVGPNFVRVQRTWTRNVQAYADAYERIGAAA